MPRPVSNVRFLFLGTGTSGGIPLIACDCPVCTSADPRDTRTRTGAAVQWVDPEGRPRCVLIDVTPDLRMQALRHDLWRCDAVLFTHAHVDHIFGLDELRRFNAVMRTPISIHAERYVLDALHRVYKHVFDRDANDNDSFVATLIAHEVTGPESPHSRPLDLWGLRFTPVRLLHGRLPILGWRIEEVGEQARRHEGTEARSEDEEAPSAPASESDGSPLRASVPSCLGAFPLPLAWCTDVSAIPPESWAALSGLRHLALDALRFRRHPTHFSLDQAVSAAERIGAERTWFIHVAHELGYAEVNPTLPEGIELAYDGLTLGDPDDTPFRADRDRLASGLPHRKPPRPEPSTTPWPAVVPEGAPGARPHRGDFDEQ